MHIEIQVALNFFISFLYNKMPRRRVNQFGEELERALKIKFEGHWYPDKPFKGSAYRCLKTTAPLDPVFEFAAHESGVDLIDIQANLPQDLSIWIDPGEVSYRMGEKGVVKVLYSESLERVAAAAADRQDLISAAHRTFNPEAQCFKPIESHMAGLSLGGSSPTAFLPTKSQPTFTIATFAQTKFGSTKLKSSSKRSHRMSPTEFNFLKQRAVLQQQQQQQQQQQHSAAMLAAMAASRSLSPQGGDFSDLFAAPAPHRQPTDMFQHLLVAN